MAPPSKRSKRAFPESESSGALDSGSDECVPSHSRTAGRSTSRTPRGRAVFRAAVDDVGDDVPGTSFSGAGGGLDEPEMRSKSLEEEDAEQKREQLAAVQALPEDVMIEVLKWLSPSTLLGPVPLVCKEWLRLSRLRAVWADSRVVYPAITNSAFSYSSSDVVRVREEARAQHNLFLRIVTKAPRVHALNLEPYANEQFYYHDLLSDDTDDEGDAASEQAEWDCGEDSQDGSIAKALLQSLDSVTHLFLGSALYEWPARHLFAVLLRFRDALQGLSVQLHRDQLKHSQGGETALDVIAGMKKLRRLDVSATDARRASLSHGELGRGLPALERLAFRGNGCFTPHPCKPRVIRLGDPWPGLGHIEALVLDVLESHRDRLTRIGVDFILSRVSAKVVQAMRRCRKLRHLSVDAHNLVHVEAMPDVRTLKIYTQYDDDDDDDDDDSRAFLHVDDVLAFVETSKVLPSVEDLTLVRCERTYYNDYCSQRAADGDHLDTVAAALARCCTSVRRLTLVGLWWSNADYAAVLAGFPALQVLDLGDMCHLEVETLNALADSDRHLRLLNLGGVDFAKQEKEALTALQRIKERHPDTSVVETGRGCLHLRRWCWCYRHSQRPVSRSW